MAKLSPVFNDQTIDVNGDPAVGYKLFTYQAGSSTKQTTYSDDAGTIPNSNPIILNAEGWPTQGPIWLSEGQAYKFVLALPTDTDPPTSPVKTIDDVTGVGDNTVSVSQWISSGVTPTYISATSFSVPGDQTTAFQPGRREQFTTSGGTVYGNILTSVFTTLTTVTMQMDSGQVLDSGLSVVNHSILLASPSAEPSIKSQSFSMGSAYGNFSILTAKGATVVAATTTSVFAATDGNVVDISGDTAIASFGSSERAGYVVEGTFTGSPLLTQSTNLNLNNNGQNVQIRPGDKYRAVANTTSQIDVTIFRKSGYSVAGAQVPVRQTVLSGPVDTGGLPAFGGSIGTTTVTAAGTLTLTASNGNENRVGYITNPSWTGLSTNGTMYLYADIAADGSCTTGVGTLVPTYRWGGADVVTSGQFTFNIQEMSGKVGNGSAAVQTYRVYVGEVTVAAGVVSVITWYALMGRYYVDGVPVPSTGVPTSRAHNLGIMPMSATVDVVNVTAEGGYVTGDVLNIWGENNAGVVVPRACSMTRLNIATVRAGTNTRFTNKTTGADTTLSGANWNYRFIANRGW